MTNVCIGDGLTTDEDGKLIVDLCPGEGLKFGAGGCVEADTKQLHRARVKNANDVTIPAATADTTRTLTLQTLTVVQVEVGGMPDPAGGLTVRSAGRYGLSFTSQDNPDNVNVGGNVQIGIAIIVTPAATSIPGQVTGSRLTRTLTQSYVLSCSTFLYLEVGDRIQGQWNIHPVGANSAPHDIKAGPGMELTAMQMSSTYVAGTP